MSRSSSLVNHARMLTASRESTPSSTIAVSGVMPRSSGSIFSLVYRVSRSPSRSSSYTSSAVVSSSSFVRTETPPASSPAAVFVPEPTIRRGLNRACLVQSGGSSKDSISQRIRPAVISC